MRLLASVTAKMGNLILCFLRKQRQLLISQYTMMLQGCYFNDRITTFKIIKHLSDGIIFFVNDFLKS